MTIAKFYTIYDNIKTISRTDDRFVLEQDERGMLYETSNANTRQLVCSAMVGTTLPTRAGLVVQFESKTIADRYLSALQDYDK